MATARSRGAAPLPPSTYPSASSNGSQGGTGAAQQTFENANASSASIVKPTLPQNVLGEFEKMVLSGSRFSATSRNPFDEPPAAAPASAPAAKPASPDASFAVPRRPSMGPPAPTVPDRPDPTEKSRLIVLLREELRARALYGSVLTLSELNAEVKQITGYPWNEHWELKFGPMTMFLKDHPEAFSVIKNRYVTAAGDEDLALRQLKQENEATNAALLGTPNFDPPLAPSVPDVYDPNDPFAPIPPTEAYGGDGSQLLSGWDAQPPAYQYPQQWQAEHQHQQHYHQAPWNYYDYPPPAPQPDYSVYPPPSMPYRMEDHSQDASFLQNSVGGSTFVDDWWNMPSRLPEIPPRGVVRAKPAPVEEDFSAEIAEIDRKSREYERQQKRDEQLARELQEAEYRRQRGGGDDEAATTTETVTLSLPQMQTLAITEIGAENVRIIAGFTVKKFGREGSPHQRRLWVTDTFTHLAWQSQRKGQTRGIDLRSVSEVAAGKMTATIARSTSDQVMVRSHCISLVTGSRTLDIMACSVIQRDALVAALRAVVKFNQKFQPTKVDATHVRVLKIGFAASVGIQDKSSSSSSSKSGRR